jgi:Family of unknown function (DUF5681)
MRWKKGHSGNPRGKPVGIHSFHTTQVRELIGSHVPELIQRAIEMALDGDAVALKICLERVCPPMKLRDEPVQLDMPQGDGLAAQGDESWRVWVTAAP